VYATPLLNNHLSCSLREVWRVLALLESKTINEVLKIRRKDQRDAPGFPTIAEMGTILKEKFEDDGRTGSWINLVEHGHANIMKLKAEVRLELLKLYRFTDDEIAQLDERFGLKLPDVKNSTLVQPFSELGLISVRVLDDSNVEDTELVFESMIKGRDPEDCFAVRAREGVLRCEKVYTRYGEGALFVFVKNEKPKQGQTAVYQLKDTGDLLICIYLETPPAFMVYDYANPQKFEAINPNDERLEFMGALLTAQVDGEPPERRLS
jgi:hypothetical protein